MAASNGLSGASAPHGALASRMHLKVFPGSLQEYPFQEDGSLNAANGNYMSLKAITARILMAKLLSLLIGLPLTATVHAQTADSRTVVDRKKEWNRVRVRAVRQGVFTRAGSRRRLASQTS
jgi:hypothetical protein